MPTGALDYLAALLPGARRVDVKHEWINVWSTLSNDERELWTIRPLMK
jgi:hypothetical protein